MEVGPEKERFRKPDNYCHRDCHAHPQIKETLATLRDDSRFVHAAIGVFVGTELPLGEGNRYCVAFLLRRNSAISVCLFSRAIVNGVFPLSSLAFTFAAWSSSSLANFIWPFPAAS